MSLDLKSADQVTTNQIWLFWSMEHSFFGLFKENMTTSGSWQLEGSYQLFGKGSDASFAFSQSEECYKIEIDKSLGICWISLMCVLFRIEYA